MRYINVIADDKPVGLMIMPERPTAEAATARVIVNSDMNVGDPDDSMWFELEEITFKAGSPIKVTIAIKSDGGRLAIGPHSEIGAFINTDPKLRGGNYTYEGPFPQLLPSKARSSTLDVQMRNGLVEINSAASKSTAPVHRVELTFPSPKVEQTTPAIISGYRLRRPGWGSWIAVMVILQP